MHTRYLLMVWCWVMVLTPGIQAQNAADVPIGFFNALAMAEQQFPRLQAARARASADDAAVGAAQTAYLPQVMLAWQTNRATRNNVFGTLLPNPVVPPMSGPVLGTNANDHTWGSAVGAMLNWELFDFGRRGAVISAARAGEDRSAHQLELTRLDALAGTAELYFRTLAAERALDAIRQTEIRMREFAAAVGVLAANELRPGADRSRADAELAAVRIQLFRTEQEVAVSRSHFAEALGEAGQPYTPDAGALFDRLPEPTAASVDPGGHPAVLSGEADLRFAQARKRYVTRAALPGLTAQAAWYARGTGARTDGTFDHDEGLMPDIRNWAAGVTVAWPFSNLFSIPKQRQEAQSRIDQAAAEREAVVQRLQTDIADAEIAFRTAMGVAEQSPVQLEAARAAERQSRARYDAGLADVLEVTDAERLLMQAETLDAAARMDAWRALFALARVRGDLAPAIAQLRNMNLEGRR